MKLKIIIRTAVLPLEIAALRDRGIVLWKWLVARTKPAQKRRVFANDGLLDLVVEAQREPSGHPGGFLLITQRPFRRVYKLAATVDGMFGSLSPVPYGYIIGDNDLFVRQDDPLADDSGRTYDAAGHIVSSLHLTGQHAELLGRLCGMPTTARKVSDLVDDTTSLETYDRGVYWVDGDFVWAQYGTSIPTAPWGLRIIRTPVAYLPAVTAFDTPGLYDRTVVSFVIPPSNGMNESVFTYPATFGAPGVAVPVGVQVVLDVESGEVSTNVVELVSPSSVLPGGTYQGELVVHSSSLETTVMVSGSFNVAVTIVLRSTVALFMNDGAIYGQTSSVDGRSSPYTTLHPTPPGHDFDYLQVGHAATGPLTTIAYTSMAGSVGKYARPENAIWYKRVETTATYFSTGLFHIVGSFGDAIAESSGVSTSVVGALYYGDHTQVSLAQSVATSSTPISSWVTRQLMDNARMGVDYAIDTSMSTSTLLCPSYESLLGPYAVAYNFAYTNAGSAEQFDAYRVAETVDGVLLGYRLLTSLPTHSEWNTERACTPRSTVSNQTIELQRSSSSSPTTVVYTYFGFAITDGNGVSSYTSTTGYGGATEWTALGFYASDLLLPAVPQQRVVYDATKAAPAAFSVLAAGAFSLLNSAIPMVTDVSYESEPVAKTRFTDIAVFFLVFSANLKQEIETDPPPVGTLGENVRVVSAATVLLFNNWAAALNAAVSSYITLTNDRFDEILASCRAELVAQRKACFVGALNTSHLPSNMPEQLDGGLYIVV